MTDYEQWLAKVREALEKTGVAGAARWIAPRTGMKESSATVKLHRLVAGLQEPRAPFVCTLNVWLAEGCPVIAAVNLGREGGRARAEKLTPERRREIAALGVRARAEKLTPERRREIAALGGQARAVNRKAQATEHPGH